MTILNTAWTVGTDLRNHTSGNSWVAPFNPSYVGSESGHSVFARWSVLSFLLTITFSIMLTILSVKAAKGQTVSFDQVWEDFKRLWWRILLAWIFIGAIVIAGTILLIIPGLYLIGRLALAPYIVVDQKAEPGDAVSKSWAMTKGRAWPVFLAVFFGIILSIPTIIPVAGPIIGLVLGIAYSCGIPLRYFEYKGTK